MVIEPLLYFIVDNIIEELSQYCGIEVVADGIIVV